MEEANKGESLSDDLAFEEWIPRGLLLRLRAREDSPAWHSASVPSEIAQKTDGVANIPTEMYVDLLSVLVNYVSSDNRFVAEGGFPNTHKDWLLLLNELGTTRQKAADKKILTGTKTSIPDSDWKRAIAREAWNLLKTEERTPGWSTLRAECKRIAKARGLCSNKVSQFTEHYCRGKVGLFRKLDVLYEHRQNKSEHPT